jgi:ABC-2 type transport system permease protein
MMGKIIGIAMVGLTQFMLWTILTFILVSIGQLFFIQELNITDNPIAQQTIPTMPGQATATQNFNYSEAAEILRDLLNVPFLKIIFVFLFYFLGGYLLYSAMFAAIGAAVDNEADTQQFMAPVTIPLIFAFIAGQFILQNPEGPFSFWLSIIPFTSPVVMMIRLPFEVPLWELLLSMALLVLGFIFMTWLAGKIYRTGILMYGKKVTYKELWKWLRYSG